MMRRIGCAAAILAIWLLVLGAAAGLSPLTPLVPRERIEASASEFRVIVGGGVEDGSALRVGAIGDDGSALQAHAIDAIDAADFSTLRYRFDGFPRTLELSFVFRCAETPDDVQAVTIPWPGDGWQSIDLRAVPGWRGKIIEFGFSEYATPQLTPESVAFRPFRFDGAALWSLSWRGGFAALYTSWFGYTPWSFLSVSALGPDREAAHAPAPLPFFVLGTLASAFAAAAILRWPRRMLRATIVVALAALWVVLDLRWLHDLGAKHAFARTVYAGKPWSERERLAPDEDLTSAAEQIRSYFAAQPVPRILVASDNKYVFLRLVYLLLPLDAAPIDQATGLPWMRGDTCIVLFRSTLWRYDEARGRLVGGARALAVEPVFESGDVHVYRFRRASR
ncbi:MAG TPA: hypothetical protein VFB32_10480 [Rudaea sp.]|nr:hypothetical protein [Rudaea sp.]